MNICVIGLDYVGAVTAACLVRDGHDVLEIELHPVKLKLLSKARIVEQGIDDTTREAADSDRLSVGDVLVVGQNHSNPENLLSARRKKSPKIIDLVKLGGQPADQGNYQSICR